MEPEFIFDFTDGRYNSYLSGIYPSLLKLASDKLSDKDKNIHSDVFKWDEKLVYVCKSKDASYTTYNKVMSDLNRQGLFTCEYPWLPTYTPKLVREENHRKSGNIIRVLNDDSCLVYQCHKILDPFLPASSNWLPSRMVVIPRSDEHDEGWVSVGRGTFEQVKELLDSYYDNMPAQLTDDFYDLDGDIDDKVLGMVNVTVLIDDVLYKVIGARRNEEDYDDWNNWGHLIIGERSKWQLSQTDNSDEYSTWIDCTEREKTGDRYEVMRRALYEMECL